jgi:hypothetical protein
MRGFIRLFLFGAVGLLSGSVSAANAAPSDSTPPPLITVVTESGDTLRALGLGPAGIGTVRITDTGGRYEFRSVNHIRRVLDEQGRDRTVDGLDRGQIVGAIPFGVRSEPVPKEPTPPRYGPRAVTRAFMITEASGLGRMDRAQADARGFTFSFDLGGAVNVSAHDAVGGTVFFGLGDGFGDLGVRARYRRWLGARSCLEIAPGLILAHDEPGSANGKGIGLVGQVAYTTARWLSVAVQVYSVERSDVQLYAVRFGPPPYQFDPYLQPGYRDTGVLFGFKLGGKAGIAAGAAGSVAAFVASANRHPYIYY